MKGLTEAATERGSARSVCPGRRDEQNKLRSRKRVCVRIDANPFSVSTFRDQDATSIYQERPTLITGISYEVDSSRFRAVDRTLI